MLWFISAALIVLVGALTTRLARSWALGLLDNVYVAVTAKRGSFFPHGLGDISRYDKALERFRTHAHEPPVELRLEERTVSGSAQAAMGSFTSPVAEFLPNEKNIHTAHFQIIVPAAGGLDAAIEAGMPFVIHLPATGDEGFGRRRELFAKPLLSKGISSIILQVPFYGKRKHPGQKGAGLLKLEHSAQQSLGAVTEALALAAWLRLTKNHKGPIGLTGISYGGAMAALAGCLCPFDVAIVSMVPSHGPAPPFLDGALARTVKFDAFTRGRDEVRAHLDKMDLQSFQEEIEARKSHKAKRAYIQLTARHDKYIPSYSADVLFKSMSQLTNATAERRELDGGHVAAFLFGAKPYVQAIEDAFTHLESRSSKL
eukprot:TRINITY_DN16032_c0_g1_i1.p1 TRINITY_DN16032_c0_g1~~TRINITY_DN16032_c0_g1_i1.p1  ORF type:complete len:371 (+),score=32.78 TRINITY_DN16032_c0_g1_i1:12-1124(+)